MRSMLVAGAVVAAALAATPALAQGMAALARDSVGLPEKPNDAAAHPWLLQSDGHTVCQVALTAEPIGGGLYRVGMPADCAQALPPVAGWKPVTDGAAFIDGQGQVMVDFNRWSPTLLIAPRPRGAPQLQLRRAG